MDEMLLRILDCIGPKHGAIKDLANYLNISPNVITNWKNGSSRSYRKYVHQIAEYFGVSTDYLLGKEKEPATDSDRFRLEDDIDLTDVDIAFLGGFKELTEENQATIRDMVRIMRERQKE